MEITVEDQTLKQSNNIKDKLKMFLFIINDFDNFTQHKKEKEELLSIENVQKEIFNEIISTKNLNTKIISMCGQNLLTDEDEEIDFIRKYKISYEDFKDAEDHYGKLEAKSINTERSEINNKNEDEMKTTYENIFVMKKRNENSSMFNQRCIKTIKLFYKNTNEIQKIKEIVNKLMSEEIKIKFQEFEENNKKIEDNTKLVLTSVRKNNTEDFKLTKNKHNFFNSNSSNYANFYNNGNALRMTNRTENSNNTNRNNSKKISLYSFYNTSNRNFLPNINSKLSKSLNVRKYGRIIKEGEILPQSHKSDNIINNKIQLNIEDFINSVKLKQKLNSQNQNTFNKNNLNNNSNEKLHKLYSKMVGFKNVILENKINGNVNKSNDDDVYNDKELIKLINKVITNNKIIASDQKNKEYELIKRNSKIEYKNLDNFTNFNNLNKSDKTISFSQDSFLLQDQKMLNKKISINNKSNVVGNSNIIVLRKNSSNKNILVNKSEDPNKKSKINLALNYDYREVYKKIN